MTTLPGATDLLESVVAGPQVTVAELTKAGVLPVPAKARKAHRHALDVVPKADPAAPDLFS